MERVDFKFKNGHVRKMPVKQATLLSKAGLGTYMTRQLVAAPVVEAPVIVQAVTPVEPDLDAMDREQLHALAKERGVKVHHMAGADRVREALRAQ
jgi:hypothetical protein